MARQDFTITANIPEGWEPTGEYRCPREGEWYLYFPHCALQAKATFIFEQFLILRKIEPVRESRWRNVYPKDHSTYAYYYKSYELARSSMPSQAKAEGGRIERVDFENGKIVHVALEPAEGEG